MANSTIKVKEHLAYSNIQTVSSLPFTAPSDGVFYYKIGGDNNSGYRTLTIAGAYMGRWDLQAYQSVNLTYIVSKGNSITSNAGVWGSAKFVPYV